MAYSLPAFPINDVLSMFTAGLSDRVVSNQVRVEAEADFYLSQAEILFHSPYDREKPFRPYLHMQGKTDLVAGDFPYGIKNLTLKTSKARTLDFYYEFSDQELADLVLKGLYRPGFVPPEALYTHVLELPVTAEVLFIEAEGELPLAFVDILNPRNLEIDEPSSGYKLGDYFEAVELPDEKVYEALQFGELEDELFEDSQEAEGPVYDQDLDQEAQVSDPAVEALYSQVQARMAVRQDEKRVLPDRGVYKKDKNILSLDENEQDQEKDKEILDLDAESKPGKKKKKLLDTGKAFKDQKAREAFKENQEAIKLEEVEEVLEDLDSDLSADDLIQDKDLFVDKTESYKETGKKVQRAVQEQEGDEKDQDDQDIRRKKKDDYGPDF